MKSRRKEPKNPINDQILQEILFPEYSKLCLGQCFNLHRGIDYSSSIGVYTRWQLLSLVGNLRKSEPLEPSAFMEVYAAHGMRPISDALWETNKWREVRKPHSKFKLSVIITLVGLDGNQRRTGPVNYAAYRNRTVTKVLSITDFMRFLQPYDSDEHHFWHNWWLPSG